MKYYNTNYVTDFHDLCPPTFPVHCNGLNFITATQTGLSRTCHRLCHKHLDMSRWYVFATFVICVRQLSPKLHEFMICHRLRPRLSLQGSSVKVGIIEFGLRVFFVWMCCTLQRWQRRAKHSAFARKNRSTREIADELNISETFTGSSS